MDSEHREKYHRGAETISHVSDGISEIKNGRSYREKHERKLCDQQRGDYGLDVEERYYGGESYIRVAGINCAFGD